MKVLLLCMKGFETMEWSVFIDVFGWAQTDFGYPVAVETCGFTKTVVSAFGVPVTVDNLMDEASSDGYDALAVPGGFEEFGFYEEAYDPRTQRLIQDFDRLGKPIASVCVAALALGKSGVLQGHRATTYHLNGGHRQHQLAQFGAEVVNQRVVKDGNILTSYCPETASDVAFHLLEMLVGADSMEKVRAAMGYGHL